MNHLLKKEKGSFTLEASLIFPAIFFITITFILFSLYMYQKVTMQYIASQAAERVSYIWNNSNKDPFTGAFERGENDGLYWRLTDDQLLGVVMYQEDVETVIQLPVSEPNADTHLVQRKLSRLGMHIPNSISGRMLYQNQMLERKVMIELESPLRLPLVSTKRVDHTVTVSSSAPIADPVAFTRMVDFIDFYSQHVLQSTNVKEILQKQSQKEKRRE